MTKTVTGTLASCPDLWAKLKTEPHSQLQSALKASIESPPMHAIAASNLPSFVKTAAGVINTTLQQHAMVGAIQTSFGPIYSFALANQFGPVLNQVFATMGYNSSQFYTAIGIAIPAIVSIQQLAVQAQEVHDECPSLWYVNFPTNLSSQDIDKIGDYRQSMLDFRSWSTAKWWNEVNRRHGNPDDFTQRVEQSKEFANIAVEDMVRMSWLRTTKGPFEANYTIDCSADELHENIVSQTLAGMVDVDGDTMKAVEPVLQDIVKSIRPGSQTFSEMRVVIIEKYVYNDSDRSITSYIRLVSFEVKEAFYAVITGKSGEQSRVNLQLGLLQYEAIFEQGYWEWYAKEHLQNDEKDLFRDLVTKQSTDV
ncbi:hypothetical protein FHETE_5866 [Fusarium heterosporum]|uniref:Uncharacterized protein n=1 Tax=Fusarium heterosporum TaxID=42747 RepID=A0A8H5TC82_FUSHE|nr:hypothetical protein FHETE_5866 [Fusarium heterosporum]